MRRFRFRLETVLQHRATMEQQRLQAFARVQQELLACEAHLADLRARREATLSGRQAGVDLDDIARRERYVDTLNAQIEAQERAREGIASRLEEARSALTAARQAREALERVRQSDYEEYLRLALHAEQEALDEIAVMRHGKEREG